MKTNRIEAFSEGVIAILITIMVLELKAPHDQTPASLANMWPTFFAYVLTFVIIAIYWVNHHYLAGVSLDFARLYVSRWWPVRVWSVHHLPRDWAALMAVSSVCKIDT